MSGSRARRRYRGPLRAVVFDWAGTMIDFGSRAPVIAITQTFNDFGVPITVDEARGPMGMAKRDHLKAVLALPRVADRWRQAQDHAPTDETVDRVYRVFLATQAEVIRDHNELIPGCLATVDYCRRNGLRVGSSTGYTKELMDGLVAAAREQGLVCDAVICADDVAEGRPAPWMCLENARRLGVYPMEAVVAVDDTTVGVEAGLNAGMWTVGVAKSGNLVGLSAEQFGGLSAAEQRTRLQAARKTLHCAGAHYLVDTVADLPPVLEEIGRKLQSGSAP